MRAYYEGLRVERRSLVPTRSREERQLDDLRELIHLLAMAASEGRSVA
jgi:hypothetical protein